MVVYVVLVSLIFQRQQPDYPLFIFSAILPWKWFTTAVGDGVNSVVAPERLIKQIQFPKLVLPVAATMAGIVSFAFGLIPLARLMMLFYPRPDHRRACCSIPVIAARPVPVHAGVSLARLGVNVFFRDIGNVAAPRAAPVVLPVAGAVLRGRSSTRARLNGDPHRRHAHAAQPVRGRCSSRTGR